MFGGCSKNYAQTLLDKCPSARRLADVPQKNEKQQRWDSHDTPSHSATSPHYVMSKPQGASGRGHGRDGWRERGRERGVRGGDREMCIPRYNSATLVESEGSVGHQPAMLPLTMVISHFVSTVLVSVIMQRMRNAWKSNSVPKMVIGKQVASCWDNWTGTHKWTPQHFSLSSSTLCTMYDIMFWILYKNLHILDIVAVVGGVSRRHMLVRIMLLTKLFWR